MERAGALQNRIQEYRARASVIRVWARGHTGADCPATTRARRAVALALRKVCPIKTERLPHGRINVVSSIPFFLAHLLPFGAMFTGVPARAWILFAVTYWVRMFFITAGYHRYFSHRSYRTGRVFQFILAFGGGTAFQKDALWWAGHHRMHHRFADTEGDPHTPRKGFWWSHVGWILSNETKDRPEGSMKDFEKFPELRFISRHDWIPPIALGVVCFLIAGLPGVLVGFVGSTVVLWHSTFLINSLAHVFGSRRFDSKDTSRNNFLLALLTLGEGWHNNHHHASYVARQGLRWWEIDVTWYVLWILERLGVIWDVKRPRQHGGQSDRSDAAADVPGADRPEFASAEPDALVRTG